MEGGPKPVHEFIADMIDTAIKSLTLIHPHFDETTLSILRACIINPDEVDDKNLQLQEAVNVATMGLNDADMFCLVYDLALTVRLLNKWNGDHTAALLNKKRDDDPF